jgi:hypothetical protein
MKNTLHIFLILFFGICNNITGQNEGFRMMSTHKSYEDIRFQFINNLIVIPIKVNNKKLNFILDSGVNKTIVFNSSKVDTILSNFEYKYKLKGLGEGLPVNAIVSKNNLFRINNLIAVNKNVYVILKDDFDLSSKMGITIHGVIGYDIFSDLILRINYKTKKIRFYNPSKYKQKKCSNCEVLPLTIFQKKPYVDVTVKLNNNSKKVPIKMLIDSGGSDAIWLFEFSNKNIVTPEKFFTDFLGVGLSGTVYGKRSRISSLGLGKFSLNKPTVSFLDTLSTKDARKFNKRNGSIGTGILKRFTVWFDYPNNRLMLKKNSSYNEVFNYNMSGLEIVYHGKILVEESTRNYTELSRGTQDPNGNRNSVSLIKNYVYKFKPNFKISNVLEGSPADLAGVMKDDILIKINGNPIYNFQLHEIISIFQEKENKLIRLTLMRNNKKIKTEFNLKKII